MKLNSDKHQQLLNRQELNALKIGYLQRNNSLNEKLLGTKNYFKLKFNKHTEDICLKASRKLNALARLAPYMVIFKTRVSMIVFYKS